MSDSVYDTDDRSPFSAAGRSGVPAKCVECPESRLSIRITCNPRATSASTNPSGQWISWAAMPMISNTGGSVGLPRRS